MKTFLFVLVVLFPWIAGAQQLQATREMQVAGVNTPDSQTEIKTLTVRMIVNERGIAFRWGTEADLNQGRGGGYVSVSLKDVDGLLAALTKFEEWKKIATDNDVYDFEKALATLDDGYTRRFNLVFVWYRQAKYASIPRGISDFRPEVIPAIRELVKKLPEAQAEYEKMALDKAKQAELFK